MKHLKNILVIIILSALISFQKPLPKGNPATGTYSVCDCETQDKPKVSVELKLNDDNTFNYIDNTVADKKVNIIGQWKMRGDRIVLKEYGQPLKIHDVWHVARDRNCIKSRKGMEWRRLCLIKDCK